MDSTQPCTEVAMVNLLLMAVIANLGSFLFGFDFGGISWVVTIFSRSTSVDDDVYLFYAVIGDSSLLLGLVAAGSGIGAILTYIFLFFCANNNSKRDELILSAFFYFVGALLESFSGDLSWTSYNGFLMLMAGRLVYGAGFATSFHSALQYVNQTAPPQYRGMIGSTTEMMISTGIVVGYLIGYFYNSDSNWVVIFRFAFGIALLMAVLAMFLPQTPTYMLRNHYPDDQILESIRFVMPKDGENQLARWKELVGKEAAKRDRWQKDRESYSNTMKFFTNLVPLEIIPIFSDVDLGQCVLVAMLLVTLQMLSGQASILYYAGTIFDEIYPSAADACIVGLGVAKLTPACLMLVFGESFERRTFLRAGILAMLVGDVLLSLGLALGWSISGLIGIYLSVVGYEFSFGCILWILLGELFPELVRSAALSIVVAVLFCVATVVTFIFPIVEEDYGLSFAIACFAVDSFISFLVIWFMLPETRGVDLETSYKLVGKKLSDSANSFGCGVDRTLIVDESEDAQRNFEAVEKLADESSPLLS